MKKTVLVIVCLTIIAKVIGFFREIVLSYFYGVSAISDAYIISLTIPGTILAFIGTGIATSYIPIYSSIEQNHNTKHANKFTNNLINLIIIFCSLMVLFTIIFTVPIIKIFASGFDGEILVLTKTFTRISLFGIYFSALSYLFSAYLQVKKDFITPALMSIPYNVILIICIWLSTIIGPILLPVGSVLAIVTQVIFLIPFMQRKGFKYKINTFYIQEENIKKMVYLTLPVILGVSVNQINILVDRTIASQITIGGISALTYSNWLILFIQGIFVTSISSVIYPTMSQMANNNNILGLKGILSNAISYVSLLLFPVTVGAMLFSEPIIKILFGRGSFDTNAILITSDTLFYYAIGIFALGIREMLNRAFYSLQDTKTPMINAAISMAINIILNIVLSKFLGISGLALATSLSIIICSVILYISLINKIGSFGTQKLVISILKIIIASIIMGVLAKHIYQILLIFLNMYISFSILVFISAIIYICLIYIMKVDEASRMLEVVLSRVKKI